MITTQVRKALRRRMSALQSYVESGDPGQSALRLGKWPGHRHPRHHYLQIIITIIHHHHHNPFRLPQSKTYYVREVGGSLFEPLPPINIITDTPVLLEYPLWYSSVTRVSVKLECHNHQSDRKSYNFFGRNFEGESLTKEGCKDCPPLTADCQVRWWCRWWWSCWFETACVVVVVVIGACVVVDV